MSRLRLLHIGEDYSLLMSRSAILREEFDVDDVFAPDAWSQFTTFDYHAVVICGSVSAALQRLLAEKIRQHSPRTLIAIVQDFERPGFPDVLWVSPFSPEKVNLVIHQAMRKRTVSIKSKSFRSASA